MFPKPKARKPTKALTPEKMIQAEIECLCHLKGLRFIHIPDGVLGYLARANPQVRALISKYFCGIPDLLIFAPAEKYNYCLMLELKTEAGKLSQGQKNWHRGQNVITAYGLNEAKTALLEFEEFISK